MNEAPHTPQRRRRRSQVPVAAASAPVEPMPQPVAPSAPPPMQREVVPSADEHAGDTVIEVNASSLKHHFASNWWLYLAAVLFLISCALVWYLWDWVAAVCLVVVTAMFFAGQEGLARHRGRAHDERA